MPVTDSYDPVVEFIDYCVWFHEFGWYHVVDTDLRYGQAFFSGLPRCVQTLITATTLDMFHTNNDAFWQLFWERNESIIQLTERNM